MTKLSCGENHHLVVVASWQIPCCKPRTANNCKGPNSDVVAHECDVRFSNRPFGVKRFQTIHHCNVDVARGLVLLFGIGTKALPSWGSRRGGNNICDGLIVILTIGPSGHANSPHPSSREGHLSTWVDLGFPPID